MSDNITCIIKFQLECNFTTFNAKVGTVLGQRRINSNNLQTFLNWKFKSFNVNTDLNIKFKVIISVFENEDYSVILKFPSISSLVNHFFCVRNNFNFPGKIIGRSVSYGFFFSYILTPYILYEISSYKFRYENLDNWLYSSYKKHISSLKSKGLNIVYKL